MSDMPKSGEVWKTLKNMTVYRNPVGVSDSLYLESDSMFLILATNLDYGIWEFKIFVMDSVYYFEMKPAIFGSYSERVI